MESVAEQISLIVDDFLIKLVTVVVDWEGRPTVNKWSAKEIMGHLLDSASINLQRFVRCTYEQNFRLVYNQNEWVTAQNYQDAKIEDILTMWRLSNKQISRVLQNYPSGMLQNTFDSGSGPVTVQYLADDYVRHMAMHLQQIKIKES